MCSSDLGIGDVAGWSQPGAGRDQLGVAECPQLLAQLRRGGDKQSLELVGGAVGKLDGREVIVSGSDDHTVRIWNGAGRPLTHIDLLAPCHSLYMTTDRIYIATGRAISVFTSS